MGASLCDISKNETRQNRITISVLCFLECPKSADDIQEQAPNPLLWHLYHNDSQPLKGLTTAERNEPLLQRHTVGEFYSELASVLNELVKLFTNDIGKPPPFTEIKAAEACFPRLFP